MQPSAELGLCVVVGLLFGICGVVYNKTTKLGIPPAAMVVGLAAWGLTLMLPWSDWRLAGTTSGENRLGLAAWMALAGGANCLGLIALQTAFTKGRAGLVWAIGQSAPMVPLVVSIAAHGERPALPAWIGIAAMAAALAMMARNKESDHREAKGIQWALLAFLLLGLQQTAMSEPSQEGLSDPGKIRIPIYFAAMLITALVICAVRRIRIPAPVALFGLAVAGASLGGQWILLQALDRLAPQGRAGLAYPTAIGTCILAFTLWRAARGERLGGFIWSGMAILLGGLLLIALRS